MLTTEFTSMITASGIPRPPRSIAARKMNNFAQNPPVGGIPASDTMNTVMPIARMGAIRTRPLKSEIISCGWRRLTAVATAKAPTFMIP